MYTICIARPTCIWFIGFTIVIVWRFPFILSPSYHLDCMEPVKLYEVWESLSGHLSFLDSYFYLWVVPWPSFELLLMFDNFALKEIRTDLFQPRLANTFTVTPILTVPFSSVMLLPWLWPTFTFVTTREPWLKLQDHNDNKAHFWPIIIIDFHSH